MQPGAFAHKQLGGSIHQGHERAPGHLARHRDGRGHVDLGERDPDTTVPRPACRLVVPLDFGVALHALVIGVQLALEAIKVGLDRLDQPRVVPLLAPRRPLDAQRTVQDGVRGEEIFPLLVLLLALVQQVGGRRVRPHFMGGRLLPYRRRRVPARRLGGFVLRQLVRREREIQRYGVHGCSSVRRRGRSCRA